MTGTGKLSGGISADGVIFSSNTNSLTTTTGVVIATYTTSEEAT